MKSIVENGVTLELTTIQKRAQSGVVYWKTRYSFPTGMGTARLHGNTVALHRSPEAAERDACKLAKDQGWGLSTKEGSNAS